MSPSRLSALAAGAALGVLLLYVIAVLAPYAAERKDFGFALSRVDGRMSSARPDRARAAIGTPGYMPPEQLAGKRSIFAPTFLRSGVMAWEALCGSRPFQGTTAAELAIAMQKPPLMPPDAFGLVLREVLENSLATDPHRRPASAIELKQRLNAAINA